MRVRVCVCAWVRACECACACACMCMFVSVCGMSACVSIPLCICVCACYRTHVCVYKEDIVSVPSSIKQMPLHKYTFLRYRSKVKSTYRVFDLFDLEKLI